MAYKGDLYKWKYRNVIRNIFFQEQINKLSNKMIHSFIWDLFGCT